MKSRITHVVIPVLLLAAYQAGRSNDAARDDDAAAIAALINEVEAANNAGDVERWVGAFADDAVYMPPGSLSITTREELIEVARAGFRHDANIKIEPVEIKVCDNWAFARSNVTGTVTLEESREEVRIDMKQIVIYTRGEDGAWKMARMIGNRNQS